MDFSIPFAYVSLAKMDRHPEPSLLGFYLLSFDINVFTHDCLVVSFNLLEGFKLMRHRDIELFIDIVVFRVVLQRI